LGVLYVVSAEEMAGKTAVCAGLARNLLNEGRKVGYLKSTDDGSADLMKQIPGLEVVGKPDAGKLDVVLAEGTLGGKAEDSYAAARSMKAKVMAVEVYAEFSRPATVYKGFGKDLLGVVINKVPESQLARVKEEAAGKLGKTGIKVLGVIPENRVLLAITVGELADIVKGRILNNAEKSAELVENYMLGAMVVDSGLDYFGRKSNKAAVVRHDRPDMQLAALETSTKCLVLSNGTADSEPLYNVLQKAENRGIPVIATPAATGDIIAGIEDALSKARCCQENKLNRLAEIVNRNLDIKAVV
jgi:BioD-like phosphotransacetylase family protein